MSGSARMTAEEYHSKLEYLSKMQGKAAHDLDAALWLVCTSDIHKYYKQWAALEKQINKLVENYNKPAY